MTTLITGGTGFVGAELARLLIDRGERPIVMDVSQLSRPARGTQRPLRLRERFSCKSAGSAQRT